MKNISYVIGVLFVTMVLQATLCYGQDDLYYVPEKKSAPKSYSNELINRSGDSSSVNQSSYARYRQQKEAGYYNKPTQNAGNKSYPQVVVEANDNNSSRYTDSTAVNPNNGVEINNYYVNDDYYYSSRFRPFYSPYYNDPYYYGVYGGGWHSPYYGVGWSMGFYDPFYCGYGYGYGYSAYGYYPYGGYYGYNSYYSGGYYIGSGGHSANAGYRTGEGRRRSYGGMVTPLNSMAVSNSSSRRVETSNGRMGVNSSYPSNPDRRSNSNYNSQSYRSTTRGVDRRMATNGSYQNNRTDNYVAPSNGESNRRSAERSSGNSGYTPSYNSPRTESRPTYNSESRGSSGGGGGGGRRR